MQLEDVEFSWHHELHPIESTRQLRIGNGPVAKCHQIGCLGLREITMEYYWAAAFKTIKQILGFATGCWILLEEIKDRRR